MMNQLLSLAAAAVCCSAQTMEQPIRSVTDPGVVTTRQSITPAGVPSVFQGRVYGIAWAGDSGDLWVLHATQVYRLDWKNNRVVARVPHGGTPGNQSIAADPATGDALVGHEIRSPQGGPASAGVSAVRGNTLQPLARALGRYLPGALAIAAERGAAGRRYAAVPLVWENKLAVVDVIHGEMTRQIETGIAPFAAAIDRKGTIAWVSNLGGRPPKPDELFASPAQKPAERVVVDNRGVAASGTVTRVDVETGMATHTIPVGLHPTALVLDEARHRLYVANGNGDSISVIDTERVHVVGVIPIQPFSQPVRGIAPTALQVSGDGGTLYVACGGINAVAVIDVGTSKIRGLIPTGWYPNGLALEPGGRYLAISSLLGPGSGWRDAPSKRYVHANRGSVAVVPIPDAAQLSSYTRAVAENTRLRLADAAPDGEREAARGARPVPGRSGEPSTIEHVVFIIKENRTYDQVLGDIAKGNGDPSLVMFGADVTPNQHRLAEQFVLLDNFYATGGNSADGHQWITQANETEYCLWPGYQGRSYPFDGSDPMAYSSGGFLWNYAQAGGRSTRVYGEYAGLTSTPSKARIELLRKWEKSGDFSSDWSVRAPIAPLNGILAANYPAYSTAIPDVARAQIFLADLKRFESEGRFPNLVLVQLPSNHTAGTTPGGSTPKAMVADNDFAVGQIVDALTHSRFWPKLAIFIVEDDAQNGVDHVDGHRTTAFVVSPYVRRGHLDSTFYSHQSMLKTIELILGLPTMSIFDLIANDMRNAFTGEADLTPYAAVRPRQDLFELNPPATALAGPARAAARDSARMKWSAPDAAPTERLNRILWGAIKGWATPYPGASRSVFSPLAIEVDDEERERKR